MVRLTERARRCVEDMLSGIAERPRYRGGMVLTDDGRAISWGAADCERYAQCNGTLQDVRSLRTQLKRCGVVLSFDDVDALLSEALWLTDREEPWYVSQSNERRYASAAEYVREKRRRRIARLRDAGLCTQCGKNPAPCHECGMKANERKKRAKKQPPLKRAAHKAK